MAPGSQMRGLPAWSSSSIGVVEPVHPALFFPRSHSLQIHRVGKGGSSSPECVKVLLIGGRLIYRWISDLVRCRAVYARKCTRSEFDRYNKRSPMVIVSFAHGRRLREPRDCLRFLFSLAGPQDLNSAPVGFHSMSRCVFRRFACDFRSQHTLSEESSSFPCLYA